MNNFLLTHPTSLEEIMANLLDLIPDKILRCVLRESLTESSEAVQKIETFFRNLSSQKWSQHSSNLFFKSYHACHLKMLGIYAINCRLHRLALATEGKERASLFRVAALTAESSHEDLGIDFNGNTHSELFDRFAYAFCRSDAWQLEKYLLKEAYEFKQWVYSNMVVEDLAVSLLTNLFSELYNHAEFTIALPAFSTSIDNHYDFTPEQKTRALRYLSVHLEDETEINHFLKSYEALSLYNLTLLQILNQIQVKTLFGEYLDRLGIIMERLSEMIIGSTDSGMLKSSIQRFSV